MAFNLGNIYAALHAAVLGAILGYLFLWAVGGLFKIMTRQKGIGHGDYKLLSAIGAWFGMAAIIPVILIASIAALFIFIGLKQQSRNIPFGLALSIATILYYPSRDFIDLYYNVV